MKKINYLILAATVLLFFACENASNSGGGVNSQSFPENTTSYTLPKDCERIDFSASYAGKKAFVIYSNESGISQYNTLDGVNSNVRAAEESTDSMPPMQIYKGAIDMGNGFVRDDVYFDFPDFKEHNNSRAATAGVSNYYNDHNSSSLPNGETNTQHLKFWISQTSNKTSYTLEPFTLVSTGEHCRIWVLSSITTTVNYPLLASVLDTSFQKITDICGSNAFSGGTYYITANNNTKLDVIIYDIYGDDSNGSIMGYQRPWDFVQNNIITNDNQKTSNECEVIHIDSYFIQNYTEETKLTLLHEFQHLLNTCNKTTDFQRWFTEMLSMSVEEIFQYQFDSTFDHDDITPKARFNQSFDKPHIGFLNFDPDSPNVSYYYANTYAFGAYLMRNYGGIRLIHEIATNQYVNESAITEALHTVGYPDESFDSVLKKFGMVYINTKNPNNSLNKGLTEQFSNQNYKLNSIDLTKYYFRAYTTEAALISDCQTNLYYADNLKTTGTNAQGTVFHLLLGPRIFKPSYKMTEPIQGYGFAVYYIGDITAGGASFSVKHKSNLSMTVVVK